VQSKKVAQSDGGAYDYQAMSVASASNMEVNRTLQVTNVMSSFNSGNNSKGKLSIQERKRPSSHYNNLNRDRGEAVKVLESGPDH